jgi:RNA polymerase sigma factor (sigma-70 family)
MQEKVDDSPKITQEYNEYIKKGLMSFAKNYHSYCQRSPSHKDFFDNVILEDKILFKIWIDTYSSSAKEFYFRDVREDAPRYILEKWCESEKRTELLYPPWVSLLIDYSRRVRKKVDKGRQELKLKQYTEGKKTIFEDRKYGQFPLYVVVTRFIIGDEKAKIIEDRKNKIEFELKFLLAPPDFKKVKLMLEEGLINDAQQHADMLDQICDIVTQTEFSYIISYKRKKEEFSFNLHHTRGYQPLIRKVLRKYPAETTIYKGPTSIPYDRNPSPSFDPDPYSALGDYGYWGRHLLISHAFMFIKDLVLKYNPKEHGNFPGYFKTCLSSHIRDQRKLYTTTSLFKKRKKFEAAQAGDEEEKKRISQKIREDFRILKSDLEYSGGSLDKVISEDEDIRRIDLLEAPGDENSFIDELDDKEFNKLFNFLSDPTDRAIIKKYYEDGKTMIQIAKDLRISQPAVSKRIKRIKEYFYEYFKKNYNPQK